MAPILIMLLLGVVLLILFQIGDVARKDPLYTDLTASPVYAKIGFLPSYAGLTDPGSVEWDLVRPPHGGPIIMADLPEPENYTRYGQFSTADRDIEEFTILLPFTIETNALQNSNDTEPLYPALHFASIGENWEIFVNGHSVAREIFLDKNGKIDEFRNVRDISIPVEKEYLQAGENFLVIHVLGAYSSKWTGLRYATPYYFGNGSSIFNNYTEIINLVMAVLFLFTGLIHLLFYVFGRTSRYNLLFFGFTIIAALYYFAETQLIYAVLPNTEFNQRLDYALMYILIPVGVAFLETINIGRITKVTIVYGIFSAALAVLQWFFPIWFSYGLVSVWRYTTIFYVVYVIAFVLLWQIYKNAASQSKGMEPKPGFWRGIGRYLINTEYGNIYIMMIIVALTAIVDIVNITFFNLNFPLKDYSLLGFTMSMAYILARRYSQSYERTALENIAAQGQNLANAELTREETSVVLLMIDGSTHRDITRKLNISADELSRHEQAIREKLGLTIESDPVIAAVAVEYGLTKRETEMLKYMRDNVPTEKIAASLFISAGTVRSHVSSLLTKLGLEKRQDLAAWLEKRRQGKKR